MTTPGRATYTLDEAISRLGIGRTLGRRLAREGAFPGLLILGRRYLVSKAALEDYLRAGSGPTSADPDPIARS